MRERYDSATRLVVDDTTIYEVDMECYQCLSERTYPDGQDAARENEYTKEMREAVMRDRLSLSAGGAPSCGTPPVWRKGLAAEAVAAKSAVATAAEKQQDQNDAAAAAAAKSAAHSAAVITAVAAEQKDNDNPAGGKPASPVAGTVPSALCC